MVQKELASINLWFTSKKLSLNAKKPNIISSINPVKKVTSFLTISSHVIERHKFIKFL